MRRKSKKEGRRGESEKDKLARGSGQRRGGCWPDHSPVPVGLTLVLVPRSPLLEHAQIDRTSIAIVVGCTRTEQKNGGDY